METVADNRFLRRSYHLFHLLFRSGIHVARRSLCGRYAEYVPEPGRIAGDDAAGIYAGQLVYRTLSVNKYDVFFMTGGIVFILFCELTPPLHGNFPFVLMFPSF